MEGENVSVPVLYEANTTDLFNKGLGTLPDALTAVVTEERNGEFIFEMTYPSDGARADLLENNRIIKVDAGHVLTDQRFVIKKVTPQMTEEGKIYIDVYAEHISYITNDLALKPSMTVNGSANDAMQQWQEAIVDDNGITADSDITTSNSTSWTIDKVQTARQALGGVDGSILDVWGGEYLFDNLHISLKKQRGSYSNTLLAYGRNITSFQQEENIESTYTSIYPYATLSSASGDSSSLYSLDEYFVDSNYVDNYPNRKILPVDFSSDFDNVKVGTKPSDASSDDTTTYMTVAEAQAQLKTLAQQYITNNDVGVPTVSISVSFVDLSKTSNYADVAPLEQLDLCDIVPVRFTKLGIDTTAKVTHAEWNVLTDSYDKIELGSITPTLGQTLSALTTVAQAAKQAAQDAQNNATIAWQSADGKTTTFQGSSSDDFPAAQHIGDQYYRENGDDTELYIWDGAEWKFIVSNKTGQNISNAIDTAMTEADTAKQNANTAVETANTAISKAQIAIDSADDTADQLTNVSAVANQAKADSATSLSNSATAMSNATTALSTADSALSKSTANSSSITTINTSIDDINGTLSTKANQTDLDKLTGRVTTSETNITQNTKDIALKANTSDVNTLASRVSTAESAITVNANAIALKANTTDVNTLTGRVSTAESAITVNANAINTKVSSSDVQNMLTSGGYATQTWTTTQINTTASGINATISSVQTQVNNSAVGTNLLMGTSDFSGTWVNMGSGWVKNGTYKNLTVYTRTDLWAGIYQKYTADEDGVYTFSSYIKQEGSNVGTHIYGFVNSSSSTSDFKISTTSFDWSRFSYTVTLKKDDVVYFRIENDASGKLSMCGYKLEKGSVATDWSANPADNATVTAVTSLSATVDGLQTTVSQKVDNTTYQTQVTQFNNQISTKVDSSTYSSKMTQLDNVIDTKVSSSDYNTEVTQLTNMIYSKVSQTDFNNLETTLSWQTITASSTNNVDANDYINQGNFFISGDDDLTDFPSDIVPNFYLQVEVVSTSNITQRVWSENNLIVYSRSYNGSNWTDWVQTATESEITQLSDSINLRVQKNDVINQINVSSEGILIDGAKVHITGTTTIDNAVIKSAMIDSLSASKLTAGTIDASLIDVINLNADNISTGTITGSNLSINLTTGTILFQKGSIKSTNGYLDLEINDGTLAVLDYNGAGVYFKYGKMYMADQGGLAKIMAGDYSSKMYGVLEQGAGYMGITNGGISIHGANDGFALMQDKSITTTATILEDYAFWGYVANGAGVGISGQHVYMGGDTTSKVIINGGTAIGGSGVWSAMQPHIIVGQSASNVEAGGSANGNNLQMFANNIYFNEAYINNKADTWYSGSTDWWFRQSNGTSMATIHVASVSQTSVLSAKTNISKLDGAYALSTLSATDIYNYNYISDVQNGITKVYASPIIDDINDTPQYRTPFDFISHDGQGRDDGTILGYAVAAIQELNKQITDLKSQIKNLKEIA